MIDAYPLCWPVNYPRSKATKKSRFKTTLGAARDFVKDEIKRLDGRQPVISTNVPLKDNGDLRADWTRYRMDDHGAAVYFTRNKQQVVLCCDQYDKVWDNLHAIGRTIEALRQIDRDGVSDFLNRSFTGFKMLEESNDPVWWVVLDLHPNASETEIKAAYIKLAKIHHPDAGGSTDMFNKITKAADQEMEQVKK